MSTEFLSPTEASGICSRCGNRIAGGWCSSWPIFCRIEIGCASQIFNKFGDGQFDWDKVASHPAFEKCEAQRAVIHWHNDPYPPLHWADYKRPEGVTGGVMGSTEAQESIGQPYDVDWVEHQRAEDAGEFRDSPYRLCYNCHSAFIKHLGEWFGLREPTALRSATQIPDTGEAKSSIKNEVK